MHRELGARPIGRVWREKSRDKSSLHGRRGGRRSRGVYRLDVRIDRVSLDADRALPQRS